VVLGHQAERARRELAGLPCEAVVNPLYEEGITSSLRAGFTAVAALRPAAAAAAVMLADMPFVTPEMIAALVERYRATGAPLVVSDYAGVEAPPMVYDRTLFRELTEMAGTCGKQIVKRHRAEAERVRWPAAALADLDVPADYERLQAARLPTTGEGG
jgi:molybdenum cofactor cytidylyltransferase